MITKMNLHSSTIIIEFRLLCDEVSRKFKFASNPELKVVLVACELPTMQLLPSLRSVNKPVPWQQFTAKPVPEFQLSKTLCPNDERESQVEDNKIVMKQLLTLGIAAKVFRPGRCDMSLWQ